MNREDAIYHAECWLRDTIDCWWNEWGAWDDTGLTEEEISYIQENVIFKSFNIDVKTEET